MPCVSERFAKIASLTAMSSLSLDIKPPIARLTLARDVIGPAEIGDLVSACEAIAGDDSVRAVILAGDGESFGRGWDWPALAGESPDAAAALQEAGVLTVPLIPRLSKDASLFAFPVPFYHPPYPVMNACFLRD